MLVEIVFLVTHPHSYCLEDRLFWPLLLLLILVLCMLSSIININVSILPLVCSENVAWRQSFRFITNYYYYQLLLYGDYEVTDRLDHLRHSYRIDKHNMNRLSTLRLLDNRIIVMSRD